MPYQATELHEPATMEHCSMNLLDHLDHPDHQGGQFPAQPPLCQFLPGPFGERWCGGLMVLAATAHSSEAMAERMPLIPFRDASSRAACIRPKQVAHISRLYTAPQARPYRCRLSGCFNDLLSSRPATHLLPTARSNMPSLND